MVILGAVLNEGGFRRHIIFIEDIGAGGLKFRSDIAYRKHDKVKLRIQILDAQYTVKAQVRHVVSDWFGCACGVQFLDPDPALVRAITLYCTSHSAEAPIVPV
jgi:hypothetical protein